jgi:CTP:molybdopterin cytidylyltransferase MocA
MATMRMPSLDSLPALRAYVDSLLNADAAALSSMVGHHGSRVAQALDAMERDMRVMNMAADTAWQPLADSVRADVAALTGLAGEPLMIRLRAHAGRLRRLLDQHERMMRHM